MKKLFIAEKPSVAAEFAKALKSNTRKMDGYLEGEDIIVTWCVGHLVTMSYPEVYAPELKKWSKATLPFLPEKFKYEVIGNVKKQFKIVAGLLNRGDVDTIYVCTDSGREGEYIYRLVDDMAKVPADKDKRRVWIDSQTEEEIVRGIKEAKPLSEYDNLSNSAYLRAKEDYLMGINFSRILSVVYGQTVNDCVKSRKWLAISVGRVMTCVLGMIVNREREIRNFVKTPFYRILGEFTFEEFTFGTEWKVTEQSKYFGTPHLYKDNGFKDKKTAEAFLEELKPEREAVVKSIEKKKEKKNPPLLFNLAELQNMCSKLFKISPDQTLSITQELYEKKLVTYPRTDARVLSTAIAKEIYKNIQGLTSYSVAAQFANDILEHKRYAGIAKTKYVNDSQITDHYAIIPTGQGLGALKGLSPLAANVYEVITRRFLSVFYPAAVYQKISVAVSTVSPEECFYTTNKILIDSGFLPVTEFSFKRKDLAVQEKGQKDGEGPVHKGGQDEPAESDNIQTLTDEEFAALIKAIKVGTKLTLTGLNIKEGETSPPKRYNSGQMILAMENAGQLIEDEELRAQIKGSGIGTSATRAEILKKLVNIEYIKLNKKTQIYTPTFMGESVYEVVGASIRSMLDPKLTASWELGLSQVAEGKITEQVYMDKLEGFIRRNVDYVKDNNFIPALRQRITKLKTYY
ncbi:MAG: type IA DNA topoisomerase [Lachnospiraceae bacterium]|nr:type IA DNA topoisomerase [Lachnospiraceae bacterium]